ncbi:MULTISPECIES: hypothetical protein [Pontibacter]|uniref:hypothetical protein n=1 Tax=Pontibacter TaxID=323449 RepID=UPI001C9AD30E|nr:MULTISPECIES: hypothetical protein [Pontibacter]
MKRRDFIRKTTVATVGISIAANVELFAQKQKIRKIFLTAEGMTLKPSITLFPLQEKKILKYVSCLLQWETVKLT